jgi:hypothetical protein
MSRSKKVAKRARKKARALVKDREKVRDARREEARRFQVHLPLEGKPSQLGIVGNE